MKRNDTPAANATGSNTAVAVIMRMAVTVAGGIVTTAILMNMKDEPQIAASKSNRA